MVVPAVIKSIDDRTTIIINDIVITTIIINNVVITLLILDIVIAAIIT